MKEIKAIVQPFMLEHVLDALASIEGLPGVTVSDVIGWGKSSAFTTGAISPDSGRALAGKSKVEIVVPDAMVDEVVDVIVRAARTGKPGDGKVFVYEVSDAVKIRTGKRGEAAI